MSVQYLEKMYKDDYHEALNSFHEQEYVEAIIAAKDALVDLNLPPYWQIKYCILIVSAEDDWDEAEKFQLAAEALWTQAKLIYSNTDENAEAFLIGLRRGLDDLARIRHAELVGTRMTGSDKDTMETIEGTGDHDNVGLGGCDEINTCSPDDRHTHAVDVLEVLRESMRERKAAFDARPVRGMVKAEVKESEVASGTGLSKITEPETELSTIKAKASDHRRDSFGLYTDVDLQPVHLKSATRVPRVETPVSSVTYSASPVSSKTELDLADPQASLHPDHGSFMAIRQKPTSLAQLKNGFDETRTLPGALSPRSLSSARSTHVSSGNLSPAEPYDMRRTVDGLINEHIMSNRAAPFRTKSTRNNNKQREHMEDITFVPPK